MTCIVGVQDSGTVTIGGDSAGVSGYGIEVRADEKVFRNGPYLMGFTSSFRMGQLLRYSFDAPIPSGDLDAFMVTTFVDAVRQCFIDGGYMAERSSRQEGGTFLVGVKGKLFAVDSDFQVAKPKARYTAIGCGQDYALGSLHTTRKEKPCHPAYRVRLALAAANAHSAGVCPPYKVLSATA